MTYRIKTVNGFHLDVVPMRLARLIEVPVRDERGRGRFWCYTSVEAALLAGRVWDGVADTEPVGWVRKGGART